MCSSRCSPLFFSLASCTSNSSTNPALEATSRQISPGMVIAEVESILGPPQNRQFNGPREAWQYCQTGFAPIDGSDKYVPYYSFDVAAPNMIDSVKCAHYSGRSRYYSSAV